MHGQGSYHPSSGQVPQTPITTPCLQHPLPPPPPLPHNLQPGLLQPQPGLIGSQNGPIASYIAIREQFPQGPGIHGSAPSPYSYVNVANAKQHLQHPSYLAPGSHPTSLLSPHPEMTQSSLPPKGLSCPPPPSQGQVLYRPSVHQLPQQQGGVQGLQQIPPPPQMPLMVPPPPPALPSSQPLVPPSPPLPNSQMPSSSAPVSKLSGNKLGTLGSVDEVVPFNQGGHHSPVCDGSIYVKGGGLNELGCKMDKGRTCSPPRVSGIEPSMQPSHLMGAAQSHSLADSDMEMEDDITQSENDQASNHPIDRLIESIGFGGEFEVKEQFHALQGSSQSDAAAMVLPEKETLSGFSGPDDGEQGSKLISCHNQLMNGGSASEVHSPAINSTRAADCPLTTNGEYSSTPLADEKNSSRAVAASGEIIKGSSPFKLLQGYASENSSENNEEPCLKYAIPKTVSSFVGFEISHEAGFNLETGTGSKSSNKTNEGFGLLSESSISCGAKVVSSDTQRESNKAVSESTSDHIGSMHGHQTSIHYAASPKGFLKEVPSGGTCTNVSSGKHHKDSDDRTSNLASNTQKIDEFGRLVREGASDSDSDTDDSRYVGRHNRRRKSRSYSRSRSPLDRRRTRRSPRMQRRRRENRSRSRSWSPRRRRNRSKSPSFRHAGEFNSGNLRQGRQMPDCFDFLRGRCYRGASCRYLHHDSMKSERSRHHRRRYEDVKKISREVSNHEYEIMSQAVQPSHNLPTAAATKEGNNVNTKEDSVSGALEPIISKEDAADADIPGSLGEVSAKVLEKIVVEEGQEGCITRVEVKLQEAMESCQPLVVGSFPSKSLSDADVLKSREKASQDVLPPLRDSAVQQSQSDLSDEEADNSSISDSSAIKASITSQKMLPAREIFGNATDSVQNRFQLASLPTPAPLLEGTSALQMTEPSRDSTLMPHAGAFQSQSAALECFPPHMLPHQNTVFLAPPNSSWTSLPPPPLPPPPPPALSPYNSTVNAGRAPPVVSLQFQHTQLPPRNDFGSQMFLRHNPTDMAHYSQVQEVCEPHHPFSGSFNQANQYTQLTVPSQEPSTIKMQTYLGDSVAPGEILKPSSHIHPNLQQQQQSFGLSHTAPDNVHGPSGKISSSSRYPPDSLDSNQPSHLTDFAVSKSSSHHNPYASTFEQPLSSRFSSDIFRQEKNAPYTSTCDDSSSLNHASVDGQAVSIGSRQPILLPNSAADVGQIIPGSGGDQYDPLFDCIEPTSNSFKTLDHMQKWESDDSAIMLRSGGSHKPLDVQETNKKEEVGTISKVDGISISTSLDNEEFGETADAEVGDAENQSQSNPAVANVCEMEIDQIKSPGKSKKGKESRSAKLFKVALADFVKEILKPSWRQGNMSKEAFKTIVKKTVDKVSGAMKSHQIPKSKSKIDRYIDSSQRKLTKLVMGYVDKYARG